DRRVRAEAVRLAAGAAFGLGTQRVGEVGRLVEGVGVRVGVARADAERVLAEEPLLAWRIVSGAVVVQAVAVVLAAGEAVRVAVVGTGERGGAERLVGVLADHGAGGVG